ncbi:uncharacterized protein [Nicotiana sylvestris]|uniref:uncharacterized protein n=1 Tax=Nicotiana sylvestris TaxID=4096 RepID=UPI00388C97D8
MTNPQDNPGTPPPPTPSNSSTPPPPSTSPKPRLRRVKMLARKTVASGALKKKLNEILKASEVQDSDSNSDSESYKSASEGEGPGSSNSEKTQESPSKVEESGKKSKGSSSSEAAEGLLNLSTQGDEPGSSTEVTLADLLKKVVGRATRSRVKQSKSDLQKALAEKKLGEILDIPSEGFDDYTSSSKKTPINSKVRALVQECEAKDAEVGRLEDRVAYVESERDALRTELTKEK